MVLRPEEDRELGAAGLADLAAAGVTTVIRTGPGYAGAVVVDGSTVLLATGDGPERPGMITLAGARLADRLLDDLNARPRACAARTHLRGSAQRPCRGCEHPVCAADRP
ncbi:hypothetical protein BJF78_33555 [Pseudonocardia sp. CNS-139]|nr:hypothetical protein BJF78_33555 [Pseudonocardia sp. CNS-139]